MATLLGTIWQFYSGFLATSDVQFRKGGKHQAPGVGIFQAISLHGVPSFDGTWTEDTAKGTFEMVSYIDGTTPYTFSGAYTNGRGAGKYKCDGWQKDTGQFTMTKIIK